MGKCNRKLIFLVFIFFCLTLSPKAVDALGIDPLEVTHATLHKDQNKITLYFNRDLDHSHELSFNNLNDDYGNPSNFKVYNHKDWSLPIVDINVSFLLDIDAVEYGNQANTVDVFIDEDSEYNMDTVTGDRLLTVILNKGAVKDTDGKEYHGHTVIVDNNLPLNTINARIKMGDDWIPQDDFVFFEEDLGQDTLTTDIEITVLDSVYGTPVNGIQVRIIDNGNPIHSEKTDHDGKVLLSNVSLASSFKELNIENTLNQPMLVVPEGKALVKAELNWIYNAYQIFSYDGFGVSASISGSDRLESHGQDRYIHYYMVEDDTVAIQFINRDESIPYGTRNIINRQEITCFSDEMSEIFFDFKDRSKYTIMSKDKEPPETQLRNITDVTIADTLNPSSKKSFSTYNKWDRDWELWILNDLLYDKMNIAFSGKTAAQESLFTWLVPETLNKGEDYKLPIPSSDNLEEIYNVTLKENFSDNIDIVYDYPTILFMEDDKLINMEFALNPYDEDFPSWETRSIYSLINPSEDIVASISGMRHTYRVNGGSGQWVYFRKDISEPLNTPLTVSILDEGLSLEVEKSVLTAGETQVFLAKDQGGYELIRVYDIQGETNLPFEVSIKKENEEVGRVNILEGSTLLDLSPGVYTAEIVDNLGIPLDPIGKKCTFTVLPSPPTAPIIQSSILGDSHISFTWNPVAEATSYKIFQRTELESYGEPRESVSASVYSYNATGLTNGTTYYYSVKAFNDGGHSDYSNEINGTPQVPAPGAPVIRNAVPGNGSVNLTWDSVLGSTSYKIYLSTASGSYDSPAATVASSVYSYNATGLNNGTNYYFVVKATNPGGDSGYSNEVSAKPMTVPGVPLNISAIAGDGKATVSFSEPIDNGGSPITGYIVTSNPEGITAFGNASPLVITGLTNGTTYTFTVKATNLVGSSLESVSSNHITPYRPSSGSSTRDNQQGGEDTNPNIDVLVNGKAESAGTANITRDGDRTVTTITVDPGKLSERLNDVEESPIVTIPANSDSEVVVGSLTGEMIKVMESRQAILEIKTDLASYSLPTKQLNIDNISSVFGSDIALIDIKLEVEISKPTKDKVELVEDSARKGNFSIVVPPMEFKVKCKYKDKETTINDFSTFIERRLVIPEDVDPDKITTGIIVEDDGTVRHVPTKVIVEDGKYFAIINSLTNSVYSVIWNPIEFQDVENHWAEEAINDMGSRMVVTGLRDGSFEPNRNITRAEFAAIMVRALGLNLEFGDNIFDDVNTNDWHNPFIKTAYEYGIVLGQGYKQFAPEDSLTREEAMVMVARAISITGLKITFNDHEVEDILNQFSDGTVSSKWAKISIATCVKAGIVSGKGNTKIAPKDRITRAEVAMIVRSMLQNSNLI